MQVPFWEGFLLTRVEAPLCNSPVNVERMVAIVTIIAALSIITMAKESPPGLSKASARTSVMTSDGEKRMPISADTSRPARTEVAEYL